MSKWQIYFEKNKGRELRPLYIKALQHFNSSDKRAMDFGCGLGTEAADLLKQGFVVHAVDQEPKALEFLKENTQNFSAGLNTYLSSFEDFKEWPQVDFFYAFHSLPFCKSEHFAVTLKKALNSVSTKGLFVASLFGPEDEWVQEGQTTGITPADLRSHLTEFDILFFDDSVKNAKTALGPEKTWHIIEVIAQKR